MKIDDYLLEQEKDLITAINMPVHYPTGVAYPEQIEEINNNDVSFEYDQGVQNNKAFIVTRSVSGTFEYWVHVDHTNYRKSFKKFLNIYYNVIDKEISPQLNADHILSRAFAKKYGIKYIRMCLLQGKQNSSYGRKFEKNLINTPQNKKGIYLISFLQLLKVLYIEIPKNRHDFDSRKKIIVEELIDKGVTGFNLKGGIFILERYFVHWDIL